MNKHKENYCTGKGLPIALVIIAFLLIGMPALMVLGVVNGYL